MSFADTVSADYKVAAHDQSTSGTFTRRSTGGTTALTFVDYHELTLDEMAAAAGIAYVGTRARQFAFPVAQIAAVVIGDSFTDAAGVTWEVKTVVRSELGICWDADCVQNR